MRITLHDNILSGAGTAQPSARAPITEAARARWVKAMDARLRGAPRAADPFTTDFDAGAWSLRARVARRGAALLAAWSEGGGGRVVAASVLLAGEDGADDAAALAALCDALPRELFGETERARLAAEQRPCLGTVYFDAAWYDNSRVELAATSLALAAMFGAEGRLTVEGERAAASPTLPTRPTPQVGRRPVAAPDEPPFNFTRQRLGVVMGMVKKKAAASMARLPGVHFRVEPPAEYLDRPGVLGGRDVYAALKDTTWRVRWHDGTADRLTFGEFLGFIDQVLEVESALEIVSAARGTNGPAEVPPAERRPIRVNRTLDPRALVRDGNVRRLFASLTDPSSSARLHCSLPAQREAVPA